MYKRVAGVVQAEVDGERVLLAPSSLGYFGLNAVGAHVWDLLEQGPQGVSDLVSALVAEYDVDDATCHADVTQFLVTASDAAVIETTD